MRCFLRTCLVPGLLLLAGCEKLGLEDPAKIAERVENEGKAVGGACRHTGRSIEDCYVLNPRASKAAVFTGWREMNDYMVQNKMETMPSQVTDAIAKEKKGEEMREAKTNAEQAGKEKTQEKTGKTAKDHSEKEIKEVKDTKQAKAVVKEINKENDKDAKQEIKKEASKDAHAGAKH